MSGTTSHEDYGSAQAKRALVPLVFIFMLTILCFQAFGFVFPQIGEDLQAPGQASLISAIPGIILGIVCFVYGSLGDFFSLKKMVAVGVTLLLIGSVLGFFLHDNIWLVIFARSLQTAGGQVAGSVYLVVASRYLSGPDKVVFFGIFTAAYQLSTAIGIVASGYLSMINWAYLFLIPLAAILVIPILLKNLPETVVSGSHIDVLGFCIFGLAIGLLTLAFSYGWAYLAGSVVLFVLFAIHINRSAEPFITPAFFRNTRWLMAISLILIFYFVNYSIAPLCNAIGGAAFQLNPGQVSLHLMWSNVVGFVVGFSSGKIVDKLGRTATILLAAGLMIAGLCLASFLVQANMIALTAGICLFYAGLGMLYSPVTTMVLGTVGEAEMGRAIGMNDLVMNVTASVGITLIGGLMSSQALGTMSISGVTGPVATYANILLICAGVTALGVVAFLCFRGSIKPEER
ncbi:MFS transporter [Collinsella sp. AGMB00827]|uniref:MFS transporter n=1 Tax=Collinsella ureilytica TaxID=2869515 RepID=A0ABS7MJ76_9ACTN|nr:MFS transporter [Collinsella urealyticum]MBY4797424.1 MFS transporter [Collinsella urealyticum]